MKKLEEIFNNNEIDSVIHFAPYKEVGELVEKLLEYYINNLVTTLVVLNIMKKYNVNNCVFSSFATVCREPYTYPITDNFSLITTYLYIAIKLMIEDILRRIKI